MKNNMLTIIKKEFARFFGDKRTVFTTVFLPGCMIYILYSVMGNIMTEQFTAQDDFVAEGYVQNMPPEMEEMLQTLPMEWKAAEEGETEEICGLLTEKETDIYVVFPENFMENMLNYNVAEGSKAPNVEIYYNSAKPESEEVNQMLVEILNSYEDSITNRFDINAGEKTYDMASDKDITGQMFSMLLPMLLMTFLFSGCISVAPESIAGEKERGTIATLLVTPMKRSSLAVGKIVSLSCISLLSGLSSFVGTMASLPKLMSGAAGLDTSYYTAGDYAMLLGVILSTVLLLVALISVISAFAKSIKEASSICSPLMILTMVVSFVPMMGADMLQSAGLHLVPVLNSVLCMNAIFSFEANIINIILTMVSNIVYAVGLTFGLTKIFNSEKVMFAK